MTHHAMKMLEENGFIVHALISDGYSANCKMFEKFGLKEKPEIKGSRNLDMIDIHYEDIHAVLDNPVNPARNFGAIFDVCHVLKLFRNLLAQCEGIQDDV